MKFFDRLKKHPGIALPVQSVTASRAVFVSPDVSRIDVTVVTTDDDKLTLELTVEQSRVLIEQMTASYYAIVPPLANRRTFG